jgi:hypothetical protein
MSENDSSNSEPIEPEFVQEDESSDGARWSGREALVKPTTLEIVIENIFSSPKREARYARERADCTRAHKELDDARTELGRSRQKLYSLPKILAADEEQHDIDLMRLKNQRAEEERRALTAALDDEIAQKRRLLELTEIEAKLAGGKSTPIPKTEDEKMRADFDRHFGKENAIRAEAQRRIEEVLKRADGKITPEVAREIENINDYAQRKIDEL